MAELRLPILTLVSLFIAFSCVASEPLNEHGRSARHLRLKKGRISEQKCKEYKEMYRVSYPSNLPYPLNKNRIGPLKCPKFPKPQIAGGEPAYPYEFPHMVSLMYRRFHRGLGVALSHLCGGTLISEKFVLTAAHCVETDSGPPVRALLGELTLRPPASAKISKGSLFRSHTFGSEIPRKEVFIKETYVHPNYNPGRSAYHDIALLELSEDIKLVRSSRPKIRPACLAQPDQFNLHQVIATGWGKLGDNHNDIHKVLQKVNLTVVPTLECSKHLSMQRNAHIKIPNGIIADQICAGDPGRDTCFGDSGGPIQVSQKDLLCMQYVVGITSVGSGICGTGTPAVYTRVDKYLDWIEGIVWKQLT